MSEETLLDEIEEYKNTIHDLKLDLDEERRLRSEIESEDMESSKELELQISKLETEIESLDTQLEQKKEECKQSLILFHNEKKEREAAEQELINTLALLETLNQGNIKFFSSTEGKDALSRCKRMLTHLVSNRDVNKP